MKTLELATLGTMLFCALALIAMIGAHIGFNVGRKDGYKRGRSVGIIETLEEQGAWMRRVYEVEHGVAGLKELESEIARRCSESRRLREMLGD